ncbi:hypothetical protein [Kitasatospora sp. NPDC057015]|uniref:hypothetical protein n=1 Tax=Kitasatospora sp. NPDC057015 TaxID=3346001 RepID=UPI0036346D66
MTDPANLSAPRTPAAPAGPGGRPPGRASAFLLLALAVVGPVLVGVGYLAYVVVTAL